MKVREHARKGAEQMEAWLCAVCWVSNQGNKEEEVVIATMKPGESFENNKTVRMLHESGQPKDKFTEAGI